MAHYNIGKDNPMFGVHLYGNVGILANNFKHGKYCKDYFCIDCNIKVSPLSKRCRKCAGKIHSKRLKGRKRPDVSKMMKGRNNPRFGQPAAHSKWVKYDNIFMRSSWELAYAKWLDKKRIQWRYEPKTFDLGDTTYTPDFYLPEFDCYIEIKGYWRIRDRKKFNLFKKLYSDIKIKILYKKELQKLNILGGN